MVISLRKHLRDRSFFFLYLEMSSKSKLQYSKKTKRAIQKFLSGRSSITNAESMGILISSDAGDKRYNMKSKEPFYLEAKRGVEWTPQTSPAYGPGDGLIYREAVTLRLVYQCM